MKKKLLFLLKLLLISLLLFSCISWIGKVYQLLLFFVCSLFVSETQRGLQLEYTSYLRIIPFLALMLATPGITFRRRIGVTCVGLAVFIGIDAASVIAWGGFPTRQSSPAHVIFTLIWQTTGQWILPFLFWFVAVYKNWGALFTDEEES